MEKLRASKPITSASNATIKPKSQTMMGTRTVKPTPTRDRKSATLVGATTAVATPRQTRTSANRITLANKTSSSTSTSCYNRTPFKSFITTGLRTRRRSTGQSNDFAYDLSADELRFIGRNNGSGAAMKAVPDGERELLKNGQRGAYLALRYEHSPDRKYNFPEATSWRIGWIHNQKVKQATI